MRTKETSMLDILFFGGGRTKELYRLPDRFAQVF